MTAGADAATGVRVERLGFSRAAWAIAAKDLRLELRTLDSLPAMVLFSLIVLVVFNFAFGTAAARSFGAHRLVPGILWTVFSFAAIIAFSRSFQSEQRNDTLGAIQLAPIDSGALFVGKVLANLTKVLALEMVALPLSAVFFDFDLFGVFWALAGIVLLHTVGLVEIGTLVGAVSTRVGRGEALVATLLFPFCTPLFISAVKCSAAVLAGKTLGSMSLWVLLAAGFNVLFFLVALLVFEFVLEE